MESETESKSEFGQGLCYNLGLFLAHADRIHRDLEVYEKIGNKERAYEMWFYGAADHLFDLRHEDAPDELKERCKIFQGKVLSVRMPIQNEATATKEDYEWAIQEAKDLLREIDRFHKVQTIKGTWE